MEKEEKQLKDSEKQSIAKRLMPYSKPYFNIALGLLSGAAIGAINPLLGYFFTKQLFTLFRIDDMEFLREQSNQWCLYIFLLAVGAFVAGFGMKMLFGTIAENITKGVRALLYESILSRQVGWFDEQDNSAGSLTSILASEASTINGAGAEAMAQLFNAGSAMIVGILLAFIFSWQIALVTFAVVPIQVVCAMINMKVQFKQDKDSDPLMERANKIAADSIINYKTIASFGRVEQMMVQFAEMLKDPTKRNIRGSMKVGIAFGLSQFVTFSLFATLFYFSSLFQMEYGVDGQDSFIALFSLMYAAFQVGNSQSMGADVGKAKKSAVKIFGIVDVDSRINPLKQPESSKTSVSFEQVEFRDVWFRYPSKKAHWVFKGLNLTIKKNESLAVVGESGAGKSTLVGLLLRFYDVTHGQILIDGVDIREINVQALRSKMGLVM